MDKYLLYKATIKPLTNFATPLKGDTLFGQICWHIAYRDENRLKKLLENYDKNPFLICSDGFQSGFLPKPKLPSFMLGEDMEKKKENRKKVWVTLKDLQNAQYENAIKDSSKELVDVVRNSINYLKFTTDSGAFAPYGVQEISYNRLDLYFLTDKSFAKDLEIILNEIGAVGFGKDATIGKGRFTVESFETVNFDFQSKYFMTLSPAYITGQEAKNIFYEIFNRFGKLGGDRARTNPFKKPLILADTAAVIEFEKETTKKYMGKAIKKISTFEDIVHQGYAITIPIGVKNEEV
ncbi:hypothetical protein [Nitratiruptor sp. YY09-18]|uniref:type III-A CRISPR-associated RAMP protein Csm4 n=1 Tax=Nitratiruptor sp. YY09-18 TaxID=2724901 RepID=UPI00191642CD|nr:hypothetical protein [Nitratiruptor sp. YY09-18]BCD68478.1 CRISPR-associated protein Csm4 [Nitratiruptor sp. YY09-18]